MGLCRILQSGFTNLQLLRVTFNRNSRFRGHILSIKGEGVWSSMVPILKEEGPSENEYVKKISEFENAIYEKISTSLEIIEI